MRNSQKAVVLASIGALGLLFGLAPLAKAALIFTNSGATVGENFDTYQGSAATVPANFTLVNGTGGGDNG